MKPDVPPSYENAVSREAWPIIAPYIPSRDLCSACLVSRKWYAIFVPFLWGDPASHFGIANDAVYVALTRFKRILRKARPSVRSLTHTLHLPPALSEIYGGPNPTWLRDVLEYLPNLQSLIVTKLPFFDHHSLNALRFPIGGRKLPAGEECDLPTYGLKLLLASGEPNTTSSALAVALPRFASLVYLDLSYTSPARDASVLAALSWLPDLQVLKLRGVGLKDGEAEVLANAVGIKVRLLDIRDNLLTDMAVRSLMQACFLPSDAAQRGTLNLEDWPVGMAPGPDFFSLDALRSEDLDHELLKQLTNPLTGRLAFEDIPHRGLTHLYISGNRLSVEGLASLLKSERLHILDGGSVDTVKTIARTRSLSSPTGYIDKVRFPGAEKLIPVLAKSASKNLTYLRVDHALITTRLEGTQDIPKSTTPAAASVEVAGSQPLAAELPSRERHVTEAPAPAHYARELPGDNHPIFELDATPAQPRVELIGDVIYFAISPPIGDKPQESSPVVERQSPVKGEGPFAPEVVNGDAHTAEHDAEDHGHLTESEISDETGTHSTTRSVLSPISPVGAQGTFQPLAPPRTKPKNTPAPLPLIKEPANVTSAPPTVQPSATLAPAPTQTHHRQARIEALLAKRPTNVSSQNQRTKSAQTTFSTLSSLHPSLLPNLRTLILTNVPTTTPKTSGVLENLKSFISACADESALSFLFARTDYSLPPGRARHMAELEQARSLFALRTIILEMEEPVTKNVNGQRGWQHSRHDITMSKSSTGDMDSENLWSAAANDFSFFGEEGEEQDECGIYEHDPEKYFPTAHFDDKIILSPEDALNDSGTNSPHGSFTGHGYGVGTGTLSPFSMNFGGGKAGTIRSPRNLPLGRNRRASNEAQSRPVSGSGNGVSGGDSRAFPTEMQGEPVPPKLLNGNVQQAQRRSLPPTSNPRQSEQDLVQEEEKVDVVAELAAWRKDKKKAYEEELARYKSSRTGMGHARTGSSNSPTNGDGPRGYGYGFDQGASNAANGVGRPQAPGASGSDVTTKEINDIDMKFVEGHWKGEIKVVRNPTPQGRTGVVDMEFDTRFSMALWTTTM
ncbi:hypothetical protein LTR20_002297 [Exophiala xenobiotica]|nr:hypothetical protein LTS13_009529 [Exophiala xenobiotica]KAK5400580.1 hypothetical protein LTR79_002682 [Exophiala xenobiotica]KAK5420884.1 hypothetical protein LTR90_003778 [Exophiala xenobiotica]KAK5469786.1 hypothetical protein LTR20_002297 [Exophiala xenobiotica]KAK5477246.1 hypothetical protein LTR26_008380 [Exophiala xenobiotica]